MNAINDDLIEFNEIFLEFRIPRWNELPNIELYMDQVITFIEDNVPIPSINSKEKILTPSMVNNYVKLNLIPKPVKRRYNKIHLAYLIPISILKYVFTIQEIKDGIAFQAMIHGGKEAYNLFCNEQEEAIKFVTSTIISKKQYISDNDIKPENLVIKMSTLAFASKTITEKTIKLQKDFMEKNKKHE